MSDQTGASSSAAAQSTSYRCPNCNGIVTYDIKSKKFLCSSCKTEIAVETDGSVEEFDFAEYDLREKASALLEGVSTAVCQSCGGEIFFDVHDTAARCPMCGSPSIRTAVANSGIAPEGIVPFRIDSFDAQQRFRKWIAKRWFAPNRLKKAYGEGLLEGLYVPFWTYDADADASYSGRGGHTRVTRDSKGNTRTYVDWFPVFGSVGSSFNDILVCASQKQSGTIINRVLPYNTISDIEPYAQQYLSGYKAEHYSIDGKLCFETARGEMESTLRSMAHSDILAKGYDQAQVGTMHVSYRNVTYKSVLLPLYTAQYGYQGKTYYYVINAQTGKVAGKYPKSAIKILFAVLAALAVLAGIYYLVSLDEEQSTGAYDQNRDFIAERYEGQLPSAQAYAAFTGGDYNMDQEVHTWEF